MNGLTLEQMKTLTLRLQELNDISKEREAASAEHRAANQRWNSARQQYAKLHAEIVNDFGEQNAPLWLESIHGSRLSFLATKSAEPKLTA